MQESSHRRLSTEAYMSCTIRNEASINNRKTVRTIHRAPIPSQILNLTVRELRNSLRNPLLISVHVFSSLVFGLLVGFMFYQVLLDNSGGALFSIFPLMLITVSCAMIISAFCFLLIILLSII
jgi:hypothetical protein